MISEILLEIEAVKLDPENLFTWTSGIQSPIYCDNRQIISSPTKRRIVVDEFCKHIRTLDNVQLIAGTATAGIPWAAWIAHDLELPMVYVRGGAKGHGLKNAVEGKWTPGQRVVLIEDLISTGKSSIEAAQKLGQAGLETTQVLSIFSYEFSSALKNFQGAELDVHSLTGLAELLSVAQAKGLLSSQQIGIIEEWKKSMA